MPLGDSWLIGNHSNAQSQSLNTLTVSGNWFELGSRKGCINHTRVLMVDQSIDYAISTRKTAFGSRIVAAKTKMISTQTL